MCKACDERALRLADLSWWRRGLADAIIFLLERVIPRDRWFQVNISATQRTLSQEVLELDALRRERKRKGD